MICLSLAMLFFNTLSVEVQELKLVKTWGCEDCEGPEFFISPSVVSVNNHGQVCVVDRDPALRFFSLDGSSHAYGQKGQGPNEFILPSSLDYTDNQHYYLLDSARWLLRIFDENHMVMNSVATSGFPMDSSYSPSSKQWYFSVADFENGGSKIYRMKGTEYEQVPVNFRFMASVDSSVLFALVAHPRGGFILGEGDYYKLHHVGEDGKLIKTFSRKTPVVLKSKEQIEKERKFQSAAFARAGISLKVSVEETYPYFMPFSLAANSRNIWVLKGGSSENPAVFDIFSLDGDFVKQVKLSMPILRYAVSDHYLVTVTQNENEDSFVHLWSLK